MSRKLEYLSHALVVDAWAERQRDAPTREALRDAAEQWRLLAEMETGAPPTHWPVQARDAASES